MPNRTWVTSGFIIAQPGDFPLFRKDNMIGEIFETRKEAEGTLSLPAKEEVVPVTTTVTEEEPDSKFPPEPVFCGACGKEIGTEDQYPQTCPHCKNDNFTDHPPETEEQKRDRIQAYLRQAAEEGEEHIF